MEGPGTVQTRIFEFGSDGRPRRSVSNSREHTTNDEGDHMTEIGLSGILHLQTGVLSNGSGCRWKEPWLPQWFSLKLGNRKGCEDHVCNGGTSKKSIPKSKKRPMWSSHTMRYANECTGKESGEASGGNSRWVGGGPRGSSFLHMRPMKYKSAANEQLYKEYLAKIMGKRVLTVGSFLLAVVVLLSLSGAVAYSRGIMPCLHSLAMDTLEIFVQLLYTFSPLLPYLNRNVEWAVLLCTTVILTLRLLSTLFLLLHYYCHSSPGVDTMVKYIFAKAILGHTVYTVFMDFIFLIREQKSRIVHWQSVAFLSVMVVVICSLGGVYVLSYLDYVIVGALYVVGIALQITFMVASCMTEKQSRIIFYNSVITNMQLQELKVAIEEGQPQADVSSGVEKLIGRLRAAGNTLDELLSNSTELSEETVLHFQYVARLQRECIQMVTSGNNMYDINYANTIIEPTVMLYLSIPHAHLDCGEHPLEERWSGVVDSCEPSHTMNLSSYRSKTFPEDCNRSAIWQGEEFSWDDGGARRCGINFGGRVSNYNHGQSPSHYSKRDVGHTAASIQRVLVGRSRGYCRRGRGYSTRTLSGSGLVTDVNWEFIGDQGCVDVPARHVPMRSRKAVTFLPVRRLTPGRSGGLRCDTTGQVNTCSSSRHIRSSSRGVRRESLSRPNDRDDERWTAEWKSLLTWHTDTIVPAIGQVGYLWELDMFDLNEQVQGNTLAVVAFQLLRPHLNGGFLHNSEAVLAKFILLIQRLYKSENPYHNQLHAAQTVHCAIWLARTVGLCSFPNSSCSSTDLDSHVVRPTYLSASCNSGQAEPPTTPHTPNLSSDFQLRRTSSRYARRHGTPVLPKQMSTVTELAQTRMLHASKPNWPTSAEGHTEVVLAVAAMAHNVGHPGRTNSFLVQASDSVAMIYNDSSVLENYHAYLLFHTLVRGVDTNIFGSLSGPEYRNVRKRLIELILATDIVQHFTILASFRVRRASPEFDYVKDDDDRWMVARLCLKAADTGHVGLDWPQHKEWTQRLANEFYDQGDEERKRNMNLSPLCDRLKHAEMARCQKGFLRLVVMPLVNELMFIERGDGADTRPTIRDTVFDRVCQNAETWGEVGPQNDTGEIS
eukprot:GHVQ01014011.1.p1 GENE.GHVQ01014011.1~~GHVQ01014011.1.p1  ORF type:complete len:1109 (+),score=101.05 GHVQ01014011.1:377-3703(+)